MFAYLTIFIGAAVMTVIAGSKMIALPNRAGGASTFFIKIKTRTMGLALGAINLRGLLWRGHFPKGIDLLSYFTDFLFNTSTSHLNTTFRTSAGG
jgi:hypothetical protein